MTTLNVTRDATTTVDARGPSGELARLWCTMAGATACTARVVGTRARLEVEGRFYDAGSTVRLVASDGTVRDEYRSALADHGFRHEAAEVALALAEGRQETRSMPWDATRRVMGVLDEARRQVGVAYPGE